MTNRAAAVPFVILAIALLAGCAATPDAPALDPEDSPLSEYLGVLYGDADGSDAESKEQEELIAACMSAEGFEYIPVDAGGSAGDGVDRGSEEWIAEHGYGMVLTPEESAAINEQAEVADPNQGYLEALSPGEQDAYNAVLYGVGAAEVGEYDWTTAGCQGAAQHEVRGDASLDTDDYQDIMQAVSELYSGIAQDDDYAVLEGDWAACMADAGRPGLPTRQAAIESIVEKANALGEDVAARSELRKQEVELALVDLDCAEKVDYAQRALAIQFALEEQFILDHQPRLDELLADAAS